MIEKEKNIILEVHDLILKFENKLKGSGVDFNSIPVSKNSLKEEDDFISSILGPLAEITANKIVAAYDVLYEYAITIIAYIEEDEEFKSIKVPEFPDLGHDEKDNVIELAICIKNIKEEVMPLINEELKKLNKRKFLYAIQEKKLSINKGFCYEFSSSDLSRVQQLIDELRSKISSSELFEKDHQQRLLRRLENLQIELHKKMSNMDILWGLVGDAGVAIGKFGEDAKPFVDRIKELTEIAWKTQAKAEKLPKPSRNPLLEVEGTE